MRNTLIGAAILFVVCCTPAERLIESPKAASAFAAIDETLTGGDSLYNILERNGYGSNNPRRVTVNVLSRHLTDVNNPAVVTNYVAALIIAEGIDPETLAVYHDVSLAAFDASRNMKFIGLTQPMFPELYTLYYNEGEQQSGQGPNLSASTLQLSEAGHVIAITAKSEKQYLQGSDDDEDVWLFAMWKDEVLMLMGYRRKYHHLVTSNEGWSEDTWWSAQLDIDSTKTRGMNNITLKCHKKVSRAAKGEDEETDTIERYKFNGKEYLQD